MSKHAMLSRVADSLYWMARYIERAENTARLLDVNLQFLIDYEGPSSEISTSNYWESIVWSTGDMKQFIETHEKADATTVADFLTFDMANPGAICSSINQARENARMVRDQISGEMWECINDAYHYLRKSESRQQWRSDPYSFYSTLKDYSHRFQGLFESTYVHDVGYDFIQIGKYLERADQSSRFLDIKYHMVLPQDQSVGGAVDLAQWVAILRSCSAQEAYHNATRGEIEPLGVAAFLLLDQRFPRAVLYSLKALDYHLRHISRTDASAYSNEAEKQAGRLLAELKYTTIEEIVAEGLHEFIDRLQTRLIKVNEAIYESYLFRPTVNLEDEIAYQQGQMQQ